MKKYSCLLLILVLAALCPLSAQEPAKFIDSDTLQKVKAELLQKLGESEKFRIERGVEQVAGLWRLRRRQRREFAAFCRENFVADGAPLEATCSRSWNSTAKSSAAISARWRLDKDQPVDLDWGEITPLDIAMNEFNPGRPPLRRPVPEQTGLHLPAQLPGLHSGGKDRPGARNGTAGSGPTPAPPAATPPACPPT